MNDEHRTAVVSCYLVRRRGRSVDLLLVRRSQGVGSYRGRWGTIAGHAETEPLEDAYRELGEEARFGPRQAALLAAGAPLAVDDPHEGRSWLVRPMSFLVLTPRPPLLNWEATEWRWFPLSSLPQDSVPALPEAVAACGLPAVVPSTRLVAALRAAALDRRQGARALAMRALHALLAARESSPSQARAFLRALAHIRPELPTLRAAAALAWSAAGLATRERPSRLREILLDLDGQARRTAEASARLLSGRRVLTVSRSSQVLAALLAAKPSEVRVLAGWPLQDGLAMARELQRSGIAARAVPDAAVASAARDADVLLLGADAVTPDGTVRNRAASLAAALAARAAGRPCYVIVDRLKLSATLPSDRGLVAGRTADGLLAETPLLEDVPPRLVTGYVTSDGVVAQRAFTARAQPVAEPSWLAPERAGP